MGTIRVKITPADPNEEEELVVVEDGYEPLKTIVGGWIEIVKTQHLYDQGIVMIVNEEGLLHGLPVNRRAMEQSQYPGPIVGDVAFVGWSYDPDADWVDYPETIDLKHT